MGTTQSGVIYLLHPEPLGKTTQRFYKEFSRDFPGPVVKNSPSIAGDMSSIPGWGTKIPHAARHGYEIEVCGQKAFSHGLIDDIFTQISQS